MLKSMGNLLAISRDLLLMREESTLLGYYSKAKPLYFLLAGLSIAGLGISAYLFYSTLVGAAIVCTGDCGIVNSSKYAYILGVPVSGLGTLHYLLLTGLLIFRRFSWAFLASAWGFIFSIYLTFIEAFVINAWCQWCLLSAWISTCLFFLCLYGYRKRVQC